MLFIFFFWAVGKNSLRKEIEFKIALAWKPKIWLLLLDCWPVLPIIASVFHIQNKTWKPEMYVKVFWRSLKLLYKLKYINKTQNYGKKFSWFYVVNKTRASHTCKPGLEMTTWDHITFSVFSSPGYWGGNPLRGGTFQRHGKTPEQHWRTDFGEFSMESWFCIVGGSPGFWKQSSYLWRSELGQG